MAKWRWGRRYDLGKRTLAGGTVGGDGPEQQVSGSGNAIAANGGIAVTGIYNDHSSVVLPPEAVRPAAELKARPGLDNLPYRTAHFVGRAAELDLLDASMKRPGGVWLHAVHGLGGVGKSTLAVHWAATRARKHGLTPVRWISADSAASVQQGLAALATSLQPAASKAMTVEALAENGMQWLAAHSGWLLILDNVNHLADIAPLLARAPKGRFLITSRLATVWHDATAVIRLDALQPAESLALLTRIAGGGGSRDLTGAAELCAELGQLPLAVEQAAAFLAQNPLLTPRTYLELLRQDPGPLYQQGGEGFTVAERTIARIWRVTLDRISELQPLAPDMLRTLAWYAPDGIPVDLVDDEGEPVEVASAIGVLNAYSMITVDPATRAFSLHRLVQSVARTADPADPHREPHLLTEARGRATAALETLLRPTDWKDPATWPFGRAVLPHMDAIAGHTPSSAETSTTARLLNHAGVFLLSQGLAARSGAHLRRALDHHERELGPDDINTLTCRHNLAHAYEAAGHLERAIPLYERAFDDEKRVLGATHPLTLASRNNLAAAYQAARDPDKAFAVLEGSPGDRPLYDDTPAGEEDLFTLTARNTLARTRQQAGDHTGALRLFEENLTACVRVLGEDHHLTLVTRNNITGMRRRMAEPPDQAVSRLTAIVGDMERALGEEHPDTLLVRANLAGAYRDAGDLDRAVALFEEVLPDLERVHGENHGMTRAARVALALAYRSAGDLDGIARLNAPPEQPTGRPGPSTAAPAASTAPGAPQDPWNEEVRDTRSADLGYGFLAAGDGARAVPLLEQSVHDNQARLGPGYPGALTDRHNLAVAHLTAGNPERARPLFQQILEVRENTLGADHPDTVNTRRHLADAHREAGDLGQAIALYEQTYHTRTRDLGARHPDTLAVLGLLAYTHRLAGRPDRARPLFERALTGMEEVLGPDDPGILTVRNGLAGTYEGTGDLHGAVRLYEVNLAACTETLGENHLHTLTAAHNLAVAYATARDFRQALPLLWNTLRRQKKVLGAAHPDTIGSQISLAGFYRTVGAGRRALRLYNRTLSTCLRAFGENHPLTREVRQHLVALRATRP
ncbi:tetratricopeptide repeat protein [Streptomyces sp. NPDC051597]|uniref:tetratricopeptide repeat protein n=1 Tax=Streptomyces sp. NPDC051597 TaxID=3155049 RepID=UPI00344918D3